MVAIRLLEIAGVFEFVSFMEINHLVLLNECLSQLSLIHYGVFLRFHYKDINGYYRLDKIYCLEKDKKVPIALR